MKKVIIYIMVLLAIGYISCKKQYTPQLKNLSTNYLAVDGPIVSGDSTFIRLSRTTGLSDTTQNKAELKAIVSVEDDQNVLFPLTEKGKGLYVLGVTNFSTVRKYRLNIKTNDGKIYQSDFVPIKVTPPIDSIYIKQTSPKEITFYADTHDPANNTRYYRWDYKDTWAYVPIYHVIYQWKNGIISYVPSDTPDDISVCYRWSNSNTIITGSTAKLAQDEMKQQQLFSITSASEKIAHVYTIQLHQYALTKEGYDYYQNLKINTEQIGSIFDPQPTVLIGNIHCITNPAESVIGFVSASTIANKQFNLLEKNNPVKAYAINLGNSLGAYPYVTSYAYSPPVLNDCITSHDTTEILPISPNPWKIFGLFTGDINVMPTSTRSVLNNAFAKGDSLLFNLEFGPHTIIYVYAPKACVDCRLRFNATNIRPPYYPKIQ